jgi:hypothetical protein
MPGITAVAVTKLTRPYRSSCMSTLPVHDGDLFEVELPYFVVPPGKRALIYLCALCLAHMIAFSQASEDEV